MALGIFSTGETPYGLSYGQWTVKWWQWLLGASKESNPAIDDIGKNAAADQNDPNVWFLAGTFVGAKVPHRKCTIPWRRAILFPTINYQANFLQDPLFREQSELIEHVKSDVDDIVYNQCVLDGTSIAVYRLASDPLLFDVNIVEGIPHTVNGGDDLITSDKGGLTQAVSDGYWVFLNPLPLGEHDLHFKGACAGGRRRTEAFYHLLVQ